MKKLAFVGSKRLGARILQAIYQHAPKQLVAVITIDDSGDTRCAREQFEEFARATRIPLHVIAKPSALSALIERYAPDLCLVVGWYWLLTPQLLAAVPDGWVGLHASLLPKYRGGAPLVWAIMNGETESGVSLFYFDEGMDTGDLVAQKKFHIAATDTIAEVSARVEQVSLEMAAENLDALLNGHASRMAQNEANATYAAIRTPEDGYIDWQRPAREVYDFIRAQTHPYPGAFSYVETGQRLYIWRATIFGFPYWGSAGQVALVKADEAIVTCGAGTALCVQSVQLEGQLERPAAHVLKFGQRLR